VVLDGLEYRHSSYVHRTDGSQDRINRPGRNGRDASNLFNNRLKGIGLFRQAWTSAKES